MATSEWTLAEIRRHLGRYSDAVQAQVEQLVVDDSLGAYLERKYPTRHSIRSDPALYDYVTALKQSHLRSSPRLHKVTWQNKMDVLQKVLGVNTITSRIQGARLKSKAEIRIASLFKDTAPEFLQMVAVHELAHLREREHNKAFYQLCEHMMPDYHQVEFDLRLLMLQQALGACAVPGPA